MVYYSELFQLLTFIVVLINLLYQILGNKSDRQISTVAVTNRARGITVNRLCPLLFILYNKAN